MPTPFPSLRLIPAPTAAPEADTLNRLAVVQSELDSLREEIALLRRRDESLRFYMHRLDEELRLAARLQQDFLPKSLPEVGPVRFRTLFRPAGYVSGDLYDIMRLDEHHVGVFICDAVGHGMPAALLTMFIKRALVTKEIFSQGGYRLLPTSETLARLNQALLDQNLSQATYATALYAIIDTQSLAVRFAQGGHPAPAILRPGKPLDFIPADGALLGIFPDEQFQERQFTLAPTDRLLIYSDGVEVSFNTSETIDPVRWQTEITSRLHLPTAALLDDLADTLDIQAGSLQPKDDLTMIVVEAREIKPTPDGPSTAPPACG